MDTLLTGAPNFILRQDAFRLMNPSDPSPDPSPFVINGLEACVLQPIRRPAAERGERVNSLHLSMATLPVVAEPAQPSHISEH
jgi:hypothetical protein